MRSVHLTGNGSADEARDGGEVERAARGAAGVLGVLGLGRVDALHAPSAPCLPFPFPPFPPGSLLAPRVRSHALPRIEHRETELSRGPRTPETLPDVHDGVAAIHVGPTPSAHVEFPSTQPAQPRLQLGREVHTRAGAPLQRLLERPLGLPHALEFVWGELRKIPVGVFEEVSEHRDVPRDAARALPPLEVCVLQLRLGLGVELGLGMGLGVGVKVASL